MNILENPGKVWGNIYKSESWTTSRSWWGQSIPQFCSSYVTVHDCGSQRQSFIWAWLPQSEAVTIKPDINRGDGASRCMFLMQHDPTPYICHMFPAWAMWRLCYLLTASPAEVWGSSGNSSPSSTQVSEMAPAQLIYTVSRTQSGPGAGDWGSQWCWWWVYSHPWSKSRSSISKWNLPQLPISDFLFLLLQTLKSVMLCF